jgi:multiple sugar transport system permease protein
MSMGDQPRGWSPSLVPGQDEFHMKNTTTGSLARKEARWAYFFISPWIIGFIIFTLGPMLASLYLSFTDYSLGSVGSVPVLNWGANYVKLFAGDPKFWHALVVTVTYAIIAIPLELFFGFMVAYLLNLKVPGLPVWRTLYYLPSVTPAVAGAILWGSFSTHPLES